MRRSRHHFATYVVTAALILVSCLACADSSCEVERTSGEALPPLISVPDVPSVDGAKKPKVKPSPVVEEANDGDGAESGVGKRKLPRSPIKDRGNLRIANFNIAKRELYKIHTEIGHQVTLYCGCGYEGNKPDLAGCGYVIRKQKVRAERVEAEHIMPASRYGRTFSEWVDGHERCVKGGREFKGRECAALANEEFARMEADLYNLYPAIGEVNADRSDYEMAELEGEEREYGACDVEIRDGKVEPREAVRGDIARTYLYMAWAYPSRVKLTRKEREMFERWDRLDPVDEKERDRGAAIAASQGNVNPFIDL